MAFVLLVTNFSLLADEPDTVVTSSNPTSAIIQGVAKWQANRFEKRVVNKTLSKITKNIYFKKWFPITKDYLDDFDRQGFSGMRLLPSIHNNIDLDLKRLYDTFNDCVPVFLASSPPDLEKKLGNLIGNFNTFSTNYTMDKFYYDACSEGNGEIKDLTHTETLQKLLGAYSIHFNNGVYKH